MSFHLGAEDGIRTRDPHHGKVMFYHWTTSATTDIIIAKIILFANTFWKNITYLFLTKLILVIVPN